MGPGNPFLISQDLKGTFWKERPSEGGGCLTRGYTHIFLERFPGEERKQKKKRMEKLTFLSEKKEGLGEGNYRFRW